jgi:hypothetical protein
MQMRFGTWNVRSLYRIGLPRRRWEDGIKTDLREIGLEEEVWSGFTWLRIGIVGGLL